MYSFACLEANIILRQFQLLQTTPNSAVWLKEKLDVCLQTNISLKLNQCLEWNSIPRTRYGKVTVFAH